MQRILADPAARVGVGSRVYFEEPAVTDPAAASSPAAAPFPYTQTFQLHSRPGAQRVIYLDFDGHRVAGTAWNAGFGVPGFDAEPFSLDASSTFSRAEQEVIQSVWQRVSEDFGAFDVDVTTADPGEAAITRSGVDDQLYGTRALITGTHTIADGCGCGGMAYLGVFNDPVNHDYFQPALVFSRALANAPKYIGEAVSHEVGHNFGLLHDGTSTAGYYPGQGAWAPIMGVGYYKPLTQWSKGEYDGANNTEDDLAIIQASGASRLPDDVSDTPAGATALDSPTGSAAGLITTDQDVDVFRVQAGEGLATFTVSPAPTGPNLDVLLEIRDAGGAVVARSDPPSAVVSYDEASGLDASVSLSLTAGRTYFLFVSGTGTGSASTGYSRYASLGRYSVAATLNQPAVTVGSSLNPSSVGQPVTLTASVAAPPSGAGTPTGTVTFKDGDTTICGAVPLGADQAACTATLGAGSHAVRALYGGDATHSAATSTTLTQVINGDPVTVAVTSSPNPSLPGQLVSFLATVAPQAPAAGTPTGTVTFLSGSAALCTDVALVAGEAPCLAPLAAGYRSVTAVYRGDDRFNGRTSPVLTQTVLQAATAVAVTSSPNPSLSGAPVRFTASVAATTEGAGTPTGYVTFRTGASLACSGVALDRGQATCDWALATGSYGITATFLANTDFSGSTSPVLTQTVNPRPTTVDLTSTPNPSADGQSVTFSASVRATGFAGSPGGTVTFFDGATPLCVDVAVFAGSTSCTSALTMGLHPVRAAYGGDRVDEPATSTTLTQTVGRRATTVSVTSSSNPAAAGATATLTAAVSPTLSSTSAPGGTVSFSDGPVALCDAVDLILGQASCTTALAVGTHPISAVYSGDGAFSGAMSAPFSQTVDGAPVTVVVTSSLNPSVAEQAVQLRATVSPRPGAGRTPTGTVSFYDGAVSLCPAVVLSADEAVCAGPPAAGSHPITAVYSGDAWFNGATSPILTQVVLQAETTILLTSSLNPSRTGAPVPLTAIVSVTAPGTGTANGRMSFAEGSTDLCRDVALTAGRASCAPLLGAGVHRITASFAPTSQFKPAVAALDQTVVPPGDTFTAMTPARLLDTRVGIGGPAVAIGPRATRQLVVRGGTTGVPDTASSVVLNVTATGPSTFSYLTVYPAGVAAPTASNLNVAPGQTVPNLVMTGVGAGGKINIFNDAGSVHVLADVVGYFTPTGGATFTAVTPTRLLDTRFGVGGPPVRLGPGVVRDLVVRGGATGVPDNATAVVLNTTVTGPTAAGYLTVYPSGVALPRASNLNFVAGQTVPNLVVTGVGAGGRVTIFNAAGNVNVLADVVGYYAPSGGSRFTAVTPARLLDTRVGVGGPVLPLVAGGTRALTVRGGTTGIPANATAVVLNTTVVVPTATSYLTIFPSGVARPNASNLNFVPGQLAANLVMVGVGADGKVNIFNSAGTVHVVADIVGYMT